MANTESITPTLLYYINYAALVQNHFKMFHCSFLVSTRDIPSCRSSLRDVWHCFPFVSGRILHPAERAIAYTARLYEHALDGNFELLPMEAPTSTIPLSFVHDVLQILLDDPNRPNYHHTGQIKGYCRRNGYSIEPYNGRFGRGYRIHYPSAKASPGRHLVEYYINTKEVQA